MSFSTYFVPGIGVQGTTMRVSVCLSVRLIPYITHGHMTKFTKFSVYITVAVARFSSDDNAICSVLAA